DLEDPQAPLLQLADHELRDLGRVGHVGLVQGHQPRAVAELDAGDLAVPGELVLDDVEVRKRIAAGLDGGAVDDVDQRGTALDVPQEVVAQAATLAGALDQSGDVGDGERRVAGRDHAEVR